MGKRLLKERLLHPLKNKEIYRKRYEMVEWGLYLNHKAYEKYL